MSTDLDLELAAVSRDVVAAKDRLSDALIAGLDTAAIRAELLDLENRTKELRTNIADATAQREAAAEETISAEAATIASAAIDLITARLSALQPPLHP